jgi:hypothetical protein
LNQRRPKFKSKSLLEKSGRVAHIRVQSSVALHASPDKPPTARRPPGPAAPVRSHPHEADARKPGQHGRNQNTSRHAQASRAELPIDVTPPLARSLSPALIIDRRVPTSAARSSVALGLRPARPGSAAIKRDWGCAESDGSPLALPLPPHPDTSAPPPLPPPPRHTPLRRAADRPSPPLHRRATPPWQPRRALPRSRRYVLCSAPPARFRTGWLVAAPCSPRPCSACHRRPSARAPTFEPHDPAAPEMRSALAWNVFFR